MRYLLPIELVHFSFLLRLPLWPMGYLELCYLIASVWTLLIFCLFVIWIAKGGVKSPKTILTFSVFLALSILHYIFWCSWISFLENGERASVKITCFGCFFHITLNHRRQGILKFQNKDPVHLLFHSCSLHKKMYMMRIITRINTIYQSIKSNSTEM